MRFSFVAAGFLSAWRSIERPLVNLMSQATTFCPECNRVIITGHSLGAAVASFAALRASSVMGIPRERITLITSGGPRTGNRAFAQDVVDSVGETYRIVYGGDIVTQLPAWTGPIGYTHFPTEILLSENGDRRVCSRTNGEDFSCANGLVFQPWRFMNVNHFMFANVMDPQMYTRMISTEPPNRWCGVASSNGPGLAMLLNHAEAEYDDMSGGLSEEEIAQAISEEELAQAISEEELAQAISEEELAQAISEEELAQAIFEEEIAQAISEATQDTANVDSSTATPAWAIGLIVVGSLVILALMVIMVRLAKMLKSRN